MVFISHGRCSDPVKQADGDVVAMVPALIVTVVMVVGMVVAAGG